MLYGFSIFVSSPDLHKHFSDLSYPRKPSITSRPERDAQLFQFVAIVVIEGNWTAISGSLDEIDEQPPLCRMFDFGGIAIAIVIAIAIAIPSSSQLYSS
ncbi:hypothetical protein F4820DRAFT_449041 [Hypoxylon rubiginosum]|uniref:Uncharacterized protein n=1 Tax=Hypoxylon rubiginosum TaxID=110542 RepID=A0ACB9YZ05_9PEZI|nr:hypothetical protein F4820DRAFT_449041 [Hypoxylon rubiginosum]